LVFRGIVGDEGEGRPGGFVVGGVSAEGHAEGGACEGEVVYAVAD
jgi:hypothetical protein